MYVRGDKTMDHMHTANKDKIIIIFINSITVTSHEQELVIFYLNDTKIDLVFAWVFPKVNP